MRVTVGWFVVLAVAGVARGGEEARLEIARQAETFAVADVKVVECDTAGFDEGQFQGWWLKGLLDPGHGLLVWLAFKTTDPEVIAGSIYSLLFVIPDSRIATGPVSVCLGQRSGCFATTTLEIEPREQVRYEIEGDVVRLIVDPALGIDEHATLRGVLSARTTWRGLDLYRAFCKQSSEATAAIPGDTLVRLVLDPEASRTYRREALRELAARGTADEVLRAGAALREARGDWYESCLLLILPAFDRLKDDRLRELILAECDRRANAELWYYKFELEGTTLRCDGMVRMLAGPTRDHVVLGAAWAIGDGLRKRPLDAKERERIVNALGDAMDAREDDKILEALLFAAIDRLTE